MTRPRIALVTGGYSSEAVISYKSAVTIDAHLDRERYDVYRIDITPEGWFHSMRPSSVYMARRAKTDASRDTST